MSENKGVIYEQWPYFFDIVTSGGLLLGLMRSTAYIKLRASLVRKLTD